jgi:PEGA domain-containing protein
MCCSVRWRRLALATAVVAALPLPAAAQRHAAPAGGQRHASRAPVQPSIGLPLPEIVPPLPPLGLPPVGADPRSVGRPLVSQPVYRGARRRGAYGGKYPIGGIGYVVPAFGWSWDYPMAEQEPSSAIAPSFAAPPPPFGTLRVEVLAAASGQVYVDGYYVGTADQAAAGLDLEPGPHRVEVRAAGYEPLTFDVRITPNQMITFRDAMTPTTTVPAAPPPPPAPVVPSTFYVIPGCYIGNVPPAAANLPDGCDPANVRTVKQ